MSLKKYLFLMTVATILSWGGWALSLVFMNPVDGGWIALLFFYSSIFLGFLGIFSILGFILRFLIKRNEFAYNQVKRAFRQGFMFALLMVITLALQGFGLLVWWNLVLLIILLAGIEFYFVTSEVRAQKLAK